MNDYRLEEQEKQKKIVNELNTTKDTIYKWECEIKVSDPEVLHVRIVGVEPIYVNKRWGEKQYTFMLWHHLKYITYEDQRHYIELHPQPQGVGVLTGKKINQWVTYLQNMFSYLQGLSIERIEKVTEFLKTARTIDTMVVSMPKDEYNDIRGAAIKNGIQYSFDIDYRSGYISQKINLHYTVANSIEAFTGLSDNKYEGGQV